MYFKTTVYTVRALFLWKYVLAWCGQATLKKYTSTWALLSLLNYRYIRITSAFLGKLFNEISNHLNEGERWKKLHPTTHFLIVKSNIACGFKSRWYTAWQSNEDRMAGYSMQEKEEGVVKKNQKLGMYFFMRWGINARERRWADRISEWRWMFVPLAGAVKQIDTLTWKWRAWLGWVLHCKGKQTRHTKWTHPPHPKAVCSDYQQHPLSLLRCLRWAIHQFIFFDK